MTVREMHIEIMQATQLLGSNKRRKLEADEIDWILNKMQERFVSANTSRTATSRGFEFDMHGMSKIRNLIKTKTLKVFLSDKMTGYVPLPATYNSLLSIESDVYNLCNNPRPAESNYSFKLSRFKFPITPKASVPYYTSLIVTQAGNSIFDIVNYAASSDVGAWAGLLSKKDIYMIRSFVISRLNELGIETYWERFETLYYPGELIIVDPGIYTITMDTVTLTRVEETLNRQSFSTTGSWKRNRIYGSDKAAQFKAGAFTNTYYESPVGEVMDQKAIVYMDNSFIVSNQRVTFIRKPRRISLILGQDCELTDQDSHQNICDLAVEYIKELIDDPSWEVKMKDNMTRTNI